MLAKVLKREKRKARVRSQISWTTSRPRLSVFRSNSFIYAQIIDDTKSKTICSSSNLKIDWKMTKVEFAKKVWEDIGKKAIEAKIQEVVFDRNGFYYHGRVKALAEWAREAWLKF